MLEGVVQKLNGSGWNLYNQENFETIQDAIPRGPVSALEIGKQYVVLPNVDDPTSIDQVTSATEYMIRLRKYATIRYHGRLLPLAVFHVGKDDILVRKIRETHINYEEFDDSLKTLTSISSTN
jgi:hypothetical protein